MIAKRITIALIGMFLMVSAFADKNLEKDITLVSYEQGWIDRHGTLALKNNTEEEIHNLSFQISYLDMSGNPLDYKDFKMEVSIAPGMTKKLDVPSYEHERNYHYYKSENMPGGSPAFKIKFVLKDYNMEITDEEPIEDDDFYYSDRSYDQSESFGGFSVLAALFLLLLIIGICVGMYVLVAVMAKNRNRSVAIWILLSLLGTPLLMILILLVVGRNNSINDNGYNNL